jgi:hypothetical protein
MTRTRWGSLFVLGACLLIQARPWVAFSMAVLVFGVIGLGAALGGLLVKWVLR